MTAGPAYRAKHMLSVLGANHSDEIPEALFSGWLDGSLNVLSMTGLAVPHSTWEASGDGVANGVEVDGGLCPSTVPTYFGLFDAPSGGALVEYGPVTFDTAPVEDQALTAAPGEIVFPWGEPA